MYCWHCGQEVDSANGVCANCGQANSKPTGNTGGLNSSSFSQHQFPAAAKRTALHPPQASAPERSAGRSALQLGCLVLAGFGILRIVASLPGIFHSTKENVDKDIVLSDVQYSVMYADTGYTTYTWSVSVRNTGGESHTITLECSFCDNHGSPLDIDRVKDVVIQAGETQKIRDNESILTGTAHRIDKASVRAY
jgi:hypothetical protein